MEVGWNRMENIGVEWNHSMGWNGMEDVEIAWKEVV